MNSIVQIAPSASSASEQLAAFFKAAGDVLRLDILRWSWQESLPCANRA